ncbi:MAG: hypothetical protein JWR20_1249 [Marmoricola sp.]|nr:hypothetical protein [Marmoricola sp.]
MDPLDPPSPLSSSGPSGQSGRSGPSPADPSRTASSPRCPPGSAAPWVARDGTDLVAMVPVVLGFHPGDSVVLLTFGPSGRSFHARVDLSAVREEHVEVAELLLAPVLHHRVRTVAVLIYTDDVEVALSQGEVLLGRLLAEGVAVIDVIRVGDERWWSLGEEGPGTPYDLGSHPFTARHVLDGHLVHRDRAELADTLVGTDGDDATAVALAATRFADHLTHAALGPDRTDGTAAVDAFLCTEARWLQRRVRRWCASGEEVGAADAGRLLVLASLVPTRDVAWAEIDRAGSCAHVDLWRGLVRRAPRDLLPAACSLLAFAAWQRGDGALAWCAVDRCLEVDPDYSMAHRVAELLGSAVSPDVWEPIEERALPVFAPERSRRGGRGPGGAVRGR